MSNLDVDFLIKALDNENNEEFMNLNSQLIKKEKNDILQKLLLPREKLKNMHKSLKNYRYIDEISSLNYGSYIRWISLKDPQKIKLTNGGIVCDIKVNDNIHIVCKNKLNMMFTLTMSECLVFQKLTNQEQILLSALNYLSK